MKKPKGGGEKMEYQNYVWANTYIKTKIDKKIPKNKIINYFNKEFEMDELKRMQKLGVYIILGNDGLCVAIPEKEEQKQIAENLGGRDQTGQEAKELFEAMLEKYIGKSSLTNYSIYDIVIYDHKLDKLVNEVNEAIQSERTIDKKIVDDTAKHHQPLASVLFTLGG